MDIGDIFLLIVRWIHGISAATWIGGSIFFMIVYKPILSKHNKISINLSLSPIILKFSILLNLI